MLCSNHLLYRVNIRCFHFPYLFDQDDLFGSIVNRHRDENPSTQGSRPAGSFLADDRFPMVSRTRVDRMINQTGEELIKIARCKKRGKRKNNGFYITSRHILVSMNKISFVFIASIEVLFVVCVILRLGYL